MKIVTKRFKLLTRKAVVFGLCFILSALCLFPKYVLANEEEEQLQEEINGLHAQSAVLIDADSGRVLYGKNENDVMAMASTTKIMTCIIALEYGNLDDYVTISSYAASQPKVHLGVNEGEEYLLGDLLYSLMLASHNDAAVAIAEHVGGSVEGFAKLMNDKAQSLGCTNTNFVTPNGLDAQGHQTTAMELALIARYAIENEDFIEITNTESYIFYDKERNRSHTVNNANQFLNLMDGAFGIKTGFTGNAGYCFCGALSNDGRTYISVVLASGWPPDKSWKWEDTKKLMNYGIDNFNYEKISVNKEEFQNLNVINGLQYTVDTYIEGELDILLAQWDQVEVSYIYEAELTAPIEANTEVGTAIVSVNGEIMARFPIIAKTQVLKSSFSYWMQQILDKFLLF